MALTELGFSREKIWTAERFGYRYRHIYKSATMDADVATELQKNQIHSDESGIYASRLRRISIKRNVEAGLDYVTAIYDPPPINEILKDNPNKAVLLFKVSSSQEKVLADANAGLFVGDEFFHAGSEQIRRWKVLKGTSFTLVPSARVGFRAATNQLDADALIGLVGKVNDVELPSFGNAAARTLLCLGFDTIFKYLDLGLHLMEGWFAYNPDGWDKETKVGHEQLYIRQITIQDSTATRDVQTWEHIDGFDKDVAGPLAEDFSVINAMVTW